MGAETVDGLQEEGPLVVGELAILAHHVDADDEVTVFVIEQRKSDLWPLLDSRLERLLCLFGRILPGRLVFLERPFVFFLLLYLFLVVNHIVV